MQFISEKKINKRGKTYNTRATRSANGYSKHFGFMGGGEKFGKLILHGTFDTLARTIRFDIINVQLKHPTDFGYTKTSYILRKNKAKFADRIVKN